jgi:acyl-coenzyme A thioesterase PaaI-like protein
LKSYVEGDEVVARFVPGPDFMSLAGFVYGGLLASLIDCHAMATAAASDLPPGVEDSPAPRYVTGALNVNYLKPTPMGPELVVRGRVIGKSEKKRVVEATVAVEGTVTVRAEVVAVRLPKTMERPQG